VGLGETDAEQPWGALEILRRLTDVICRKAKALGELVRVKQQALGTNWRDLGMWDK